MMGVRVYTTADVLVLAGDMLHSIYAFKNDFRHLDYPLSVYAIPRGGIPARLALLTIAGAGRFSLSEDPRTADIIVDDLIDTGKTIERFAGRPCFALIDKRSWAHGNDWVVWPWEGSASAGIEDNITRLLEFVGEDPKRGGLLETPARVAKAWKHWCGGYDVDPASLLKVFEDGAEKVNEMVLVKNIPFFSHCEHHMAPFFGTATVGYIPDGKRIVGLSKINRVVDCFARRLQVQERMTTQIADAFMEHLAPKGVGVIVTARHMCVESRGVAHHGSETTTSALRGVFEDGTVRQEFLLLSK